MAPCAPSPTSSRRPSPASGAAGSSTPSPSGTIAVSLFVLGAFLTVASNLNEVVDRWAEKVRVTFFLADGLEATSATAWSAGSATIRRWSRWSSCRARRPWSASAPSSATCARCPTTSGENPFPASLEVALRAGRQSPEEVRRLVQAFEKAPGVQEVQYDLLWIERLSTAARLVRGVGALAGRHPRAGRRVHDLERDPPDRLRAPGRARHHAPGGRHARLREGAVRDGRHAAGRPGRARRGRAPLGGLPRARRRSDGRLRPDGPRGGAACRGRLSWLLVVGGMGVGVVGSLVSLGRSRRSASCTLARASRTCTSCPARAGGGACGSGRAPAGGCASGASA